jgi:hypothetical protein
LFPNDGVCVVLDGIDELIREGKSEEVLMPSSWMKGLDKEGRLLPQFVLTCADTKCQNDVQHSIGLKTSQLEVIEVHAMKGQCSEVAEIPSTSAAANVTQVLQFLREARTALSAKDVACSELANKPEGAIQSAMDKMVEVQLHRHRAGYTLRRLLQENTVGTTEELKEVHKRLHHFYEVSAVIIAGVQYA